MKKILPLLVLVFLSNLTLVEASGAYNTSSGIIYTERVYLKTIFVNQDPTSAEPGGYVDLLFKIENWGTEDAENVTFELLPEYPFSLDPGVSATKELGTIKGLQRDEDVFLVRYKLRVDEDAIEGENEIELRYSYGSGATYSTKKFYIIVSNPRTNFEVVAQDLTTLAIANTGANTAYSVIVKIPDQKNFKVIGTSANIIGNLDAGDYTLASFQINSIWGAEEKNLTVEISYTDLLGIRRTIQKNVLFKFSSGTKTITEKNQPEIIGSSGFMYIIIGVVGIIVIVAIIKFRKRKKK